MKQLFLLITFLVLSMPFSFGNFKEDQKRYSRVREAYAQKENYLKKQLTPFQITIGEIQLYIRAFKYEKEIELWAKNRQDSNYQLINTYPVCALSGEIGPKRKQGDLQIPEGFYHINRFNPSSNFHLSLGINYPNKSDQILGSRGKLGGDIFIHGNCVTIGCLPITDNLIKELYVYCIEAKNNGQVKIPVTIFPAKLNETNMQFLKQKYANNNEYLNLWEDLKVGFDAFNSSHTLPDIAFAENGRYIVSH